MPHRKSTARRLLAFAAPVWPWIALSVALGTATVASSVALLATSAWIIAMAALQPSIAVLQVAIVGVRFFGISRGLLRYGERLVTHQVTFRLLAAFRVWFYQRIEPLAPAVFTRYRSGDLLARVVADVETLENFYVRGLAPPLVAAFVALGMGFFFAAYDRALAVWLLAALAAAGLGVPLLVGAVGRRPGRELVAARGELNAALVDTIQGLPDLLAFGQSPAQLARVAGLGGRLAAAQSGMITLRALHTGLGSLLSGFAILGVLVLAIPLVRGAQLSGVDLAVLALAAGACFEAVLPLAPAAQYLQASLAAAGRLFAVVDEPGERPAHAPTGAVQDAPDLWRGNLRPSTTGSGEGSPGEAIAQHHGGAGGGGLSGAHALELRDVSFSYSTGDPPALDRVSLALPQGGVLGLVGASGAGKTSLLNLLLRFWDYQRGEILLYGRDLRTYRPEAARGLLAVVTQNTHLFNATVRDNLLLARPGATRDELESAAAGAGIHDFITRLPDGYDTWIGEGGLLLSGGERQRLAIARALLKDAPLLILDEATANLDTVTERAVLAGIRRMMSGRTTLMITHRLAAVELASQVLVMEQGRVVEQGTPAGLLAQESIYRRMWLGQAEAAVLEDL